MPDLDPRAELQYVRQLMAEGERSFQESGAHFLIWGVATAAGLALTWLAIRAAAPPPGWLWVGWAAVLLIACVGAVMAGRRENRRAPAHTLAGRMLGDVWGGIGVAILLLGLGGGAVGILPGPAIPVVVATLLGAGYFATASLYRKVPLRALALGWWTGAVAMAIWPGTHSVLVLALLVLVLEVAPGIVLVRGPKHEATTAE